MKKPPCIRGLKEFKNGCPERKWDGKEGCPAWVSVKMSVKGQVESVEINECLDLYRSRLHYSTNALLEGNVQTLEAFRNNMTTPHGPRPDPAVCKMLEMINNRMISD